MKVNIPSEEEYQHEKKKRRIQAFFGLIAGLFFFSILGSSIFLYGLDEVNLSTWLALILGVLSFSFLAYKFGDQFWAILFKG